MHRSEAPAAIFRPASNETGVVGQRLAESARTYEDSGHDFFGYRKGRFMLVSTIKIPRRIE